MNDANEVIPQETYHVIAEVITGIGVGFGIYGLRNLLAGYSNNSPSAKELDERQIKTGCNLVILAAYIEKGTLPPSDIEYLALQ